MIVSASRRTDIPAFHFPWLLERMRLGFVETANPFNARQVRRVSLRPGDAELFVFWTKDARPMEALLPEFESHGIPYLVLYTLTPYDERLEPGIHDKAGIALSFRRLADRIGPDRIAWRYDPVILTPELSADFHLAAFERIAGRLAGSTGRCITSFAAPYRRVRRRLESLGWREPPAEARRLLLARLAAAAAARGMALQTCADDAPAAGWPGACIDGGLVSRVLGRETGPGRDPHQRPACLCARSVDIGAYGTCPHGCVYCYAGGAGTASGRP